MKIEISIDELRSIIREVVSEEIKKNELPPVLSEKDVYSCFEVSRLFHVVKPTILKWAKNGFLNYEIRNGMYFFKKSDIDSICCSIGSRSKVKFSDIVSWKGK